MQSTPAVMVATEAAAARPWRERSVSVLHLLTSLVLSLLYLVPVLLLTSIVNGVSWTLVLMLQERAVLLDTLVTVLSVAILLPLTTLLARLACRIQRSRLEGVFGIVEAGVPPSAPEGGRTVRTARHLFGRDAWGAVFYSTAAGFSSLFTGGLVLVLIGVGGAALGVLIGAGATLVNGTFATLVTDTNVLQPLLLLVVFGPAAAVAGFWAAPLLVRADVALAQRLLFDSPRVQAHRRIIELHDSRLRMVDAAEAERRRIERDLHDGAQQRLLAVTMTLTRARSKFDRDPEQARTLLEEAQAESKAVMAELREVARGLHPRVLTDHGLEAALPVAAGRCPLPVRVEVELAERPSSRAEGVAYYVACEALTNVTKHAGAETATVRAERIGRRRGDLLRLTVTDDGKGGAEPDAGTGLYGLWDRINAVDGTLTLHSPSGEGTVLTADIPWRA
ncbi:signal transduction histidine kinase [Spinactinospora alkalitolerans]|uniref:histidine kinase n=1 Tax=Spinactinospora alkalitolerans TaxID=687207 RepID=A0A852TPA3_9ACTN|nr:histidine kinase [Spinactinospora alkalitolerans]NYE45281.1 signal transduction histidine kinase [Spinactinospora alkalitolerans]